MSDNHDIPGRREPRRAEPIQPDNPGQGTGQEPEKGVDSVSEQGTARQPPRTGSERVSETGTAPS